MKLFKQNTVGRLVLVVFICFIVAVISAEAETIEDMTALIESHPDGHIDWKNGLVYGVGKGYLDVNGGDKNKALKAARAISLQSILKVIAGVRLDDRRTLENLHKDGVIIQLQALIRYDVVESRFVKDVQRPYFEVGSRAPIKGVEGLTAKLIDALRSKPLPWPQSFPIQPIEQTTDSQEEIESWLVLFANDLPENKLVMPALFPKIISVSGEEIYDLKMVDESDLKKQGAMFQYVMSDKKASEFGSRGTHLDKFFSGLKSLFSPVNAMADDTKKREKRKRYIVKSVQGAEGLMKTNLLINEKDAQELKQDETAGIILKKCRVIVVVNSPIGGIEGSLPIIYAQQQRSNF